MKVLFITQPSDRPDGYVVLSESSHWVRWLSRNIPPSLHREVRRRLSSNLKHLLVGLELKAALIFPHHYRTASERPVLFEPYFQNLILEFCVGAFSVLEGLGSAQWLAHQGSDGSDSPRITRDQWLAALSAVYDQKGEHGLVDAVGRTLAVRDKLHQDRLGSREDIDWHALSYEEAFVPASHAIRTVLRHDLNAVPATSNLHFDPKDVRGEASTLAAAGEEAATIYAVRAK